MSDENTAPPSPPSGEDNKPYLTPVDGKFVFQIDSMMRIRFNADGWVEEIGRGGLDDPLGTKLQGKPKSKRDDLVARRYYDLFSRAVILEVFPDTPNDRCKAEGLVLFKDIDPDAPLYERINMIIEIGNTHFGMNLKMLSH